MGTRIDISGHTYGRLSVIMQLEQKTSSGKVLWLCRCSCGNEIKTNANSMRTGAAKSCGCLQKEAARRTGHKNTTHGFSRTAISGTYRSWSMMIQRCTNQKRDNYKYYGGKGVAVCDRWMTFENFVEDLGERPGRAYCLSRNGDVGNYEPGNAAWKLKSVNLDEMNARRVVQ